MSAKKAARRVMNSGIGGMCHFAVADVAREAAKELYDTVMGNNEVRVRWIEQNPGLDEAELIDRFVDRNWWKCIEYAKHTMALMLRRPDLDERIKDGIMDALIKDNEVSATRRGYRERMH